MSEIRPADKKDMVITETSELDCMTVVATTPKPSDLPSEPVAFSKAFSRKPPLNSLKPSSSINMPKRKIATPAAIS